MKTTTIKRNTRKIRVIRIPLWIRLTVFFALAISAIAITFGTTVITGNLGGGYRAQSAAFFITGFITTTGTCYICDKISEGYIKCEFNT